MKTKLAILAVLALFVMFFLLIGSRNAPYAQPLPPIPLGQCLKPPALVSSLERSGLEMRPDGSVVHVKTAQQFQPTCQESAPTIGRSCINCSNPEEVQKGIGRCVWFLKGTTCALSIPILGIDIAWTISETFACVGPLGQEVPGDPLPVSEILTMLEVNGASCIDRVEGDSQSGIAFVELSPPNSRVCGRHIVGGGRVVECARGTP